MVEDRVDSDTRAQESPADEQAAIGHGRLIGASVVFAASFAIYYWTLAPTVTFVDSGELILAARVLGVAHPPGFPLYVLLAHAASLLPVGNIAVRVHLASALFAALASATMTLLVIEATLTIPKDAKSTTVPGEIALSIITPAVTAGLLLAFSRTLWAYATIAEVYTLNTLLIVIIFWLAFAWRREALNCCATKAQAKYSKLYAATFTFGLALGVHHVSVGLTFPALAALVLSTTGIGFIRSKRFLHAALFSSLGLGIYIYLPIAASQSPLMNWGDPRTLERFWWHITGRQYQAYFDFSLSRITEFPRFASREFGMTSIPLALALAGAGLASLVRRDRVMLAFLLLVIVFDVTYCLGYDIAEDKDAYYLPASIAMTIATALGVQWAIAAWKGKVRTAILASGYPAAALLILAIPLLALSGNLPSNDRSHFYVAHDYVDNILRSIEPHGMLLTTDWQVYSPSLYTREIERQRSDAVVIDVNLLRRSWYYDYLRQAYPTLAGNSRREVDAFLTDLRAWERNPDAYAMNAFLRRRINSRFYEMILSIIANEVEDRPVYVTSEILLNRSGQDADLASALMEKYKLVPKGLVFRVSKRSDTARLEQPELLVRGLGGGATDNDDVIRKKVIPVYLRMAVISGVYLASQGRREQAIEEFKLALAIDPTFEPAMRALAKSQNASQKDHR